MDERRPATPLWVKAIGLGILIVLVLAAVILIVGGGKHGPGMHGALGPDPAPIAAAIRGFDRA
jgi:hypothetical protein